jgi:hypothetical protein
MPNLPIAFLVYRRLLSRPESTRDQVVAELKLDPRIVRTELEGAPDIRALRPAEGLQFLANLPHKPAHPEVPLKMANPQAWIDGYTGQKWASGETAESWHGGPPPACHLFYVPPTQAHQAVEAAVQLGGRVVQRKGANLLIRQADAWLQPDTDDPQVVERGQYNLDWREVHAAILGNVR